MSFILLLLQIQNIKNMFYQFFTMDRKNYQRGSVEKDADRQRNSETIQDQEITKCRTSNKT